MALISGGSSTGLGYRAGQRAHKYSSAEHDHHTKYSQSKNTGNTAGAKVNIR